ncbi:MAG: hypothetical protein A2Y17_04345 [Clostridiales bacterium GWF2_38_85]|nr:MAG: hypothetical protein A2Y17_04345 [Clostridiales bacterium GWF2_38_85]HBL83418.1 endoflagellar protein [Clostridiales bacterium]
MIELTKLNLEKFYMNSDLIEIIEQMPDTLITMTTGKKYYAIETPDEIIGEIKEYKKELIENTGELYVKKELKKPKNEDANKTKKRKSEE